VKALSESNPDLRIVVLSGTDVPVNFSSRRVRTAGACDVIAETPTDRTIAIASQTAETLAGVLQHIAATGTSEIQRHPDQSLGIRSNNPSTDTAMHTTSVRVESRSGPAEIVAIASSTGGPEALEELLTGIPNSFVPPIVIVQHIAADFSASLAERLSRQTGLDVRQASNEAQLDSGIVWVAPGGRHLEVKSRALRHRLVLNDDAPENSCRPSADVLFRSVAHSFGPHALSVVLTGLGSDGCAGARCIREADGYVLAQDEATSRVWSMPRHVIEAGLADMVVGLPDMSAEIIRRCRAVRGATQ
jgi:two-component system chemotaxis response regulator CheB